MGHYRYRDDITSADFAFDADGDTPEDLFMTCADALLGLMIADVTLIAPRVTTTISFSGNGPEDLLYDFLQYMLFLKDAESLFMRATKLKLSGHTLDAEFAGDRINQYADFLGTDVKGITMHQFEVRKGARLWSATVVVDA